MRVWTQEIKKMDNEEILYHVLTNLEEYYNGNIDKMEFGLRHRKTMKNFKEEV